MDDVLLALCGGPVPCPVEDSLVLFLEEKGEAWAVSAAICLKQSV